MGLDLLEKITDTYERKARLYPALIVLIPPLGVIIWFYGISFQIGTGLVSLLATVGIFYLLSSIVREVGKRLEEKLFETWGGKPTTQLLRHRDKKIDPITKARYHVFLSRQLNIEFPSRADECAEPLTADHIYASGVKWLLDQTRDTKKFNILYKENIAYGFHRNCLGLKHLALVIACGCVLWILVAQGVITSQGLKREVLVTLPNEAWASLIISATMPAVWLLFLTRRTVRSAAFTYAEMLLKACDVLNQEK